MNGMEIATLALSVAALAITGWAHWTMRKAEKRIAEAHERIRAARQP